MHGREKRKTTECTRSECQQKNRNLKIFIKLNFGDIVEKKNYKQKNEIIIYKVLLCNFTTVLRPQQCENWQKKVATK
jgi:hypothetical protein